MHFELSQDYETMKLNAVRCLASYLSVEHGIDTLVLGVSGGVDSALVAALARFIVNSRPDKWQLIGKSLPIESNEEEVMRSNYVGSNFCDVFTIQDLSSTYYSVLEHGWPVESTMSDRDLTFEEKVRRGNIKARLRMMNLFDLAHRTNGIVLSTDNLTEYMLGFWTLHGDVGNYGMIQNLWKTEVYGLTNYISQSIRENNQPAAQALDDCINAVPTDGLGITDSDLDQFGEESYAVVDRILIDFVNGKDFDPENKVIQTHIRTYFKRQDPINISRADLLKSKRGIYVPSVF